MLNGALLILSQVHNPSLIYLHLYQRTKVYEMEGICKVATHIVDVPLSDSELHLTCDRL